jgi:predicted Co/Zn/Cd cation transporter (cation efflux family)
MNNISTATAAPVKPVLNPAHAKMAQQALLIAAMAVFALTVDQSLAGAAVITKLNTFCATWIKPIYLGILALVVLGMCYKGFIEMVNEEGNGGRKIGMALIGGSAAVLVPAAILAAVATGATFTC